MLQKFSLDDAHWKVLRLLEINPRINQRELAVALGVSLGKVNYCLRALLGKGLLKMQNFQSSKRKLAYAYAYAYAYAEIESLQQEINKASSTEKSAT